MDAYVYGHLSHVLATDLPSQILRPKLVRHRNLVDFCARFRVRASALCPPVVRGVVYHSHTLTSTLSISTRAKLTPRTFTGTIFWQRMTLSRRAAPASSQLCGPEIVLTVAKRLALPRSGSHQCSYHPLVKTEGSFPLTLAPRTGTCPRRIPPLTFEESPGGGDHRAHEMVSALSDTSLINAWLRGQCSHCTTASRTKSHPTLYAPDAFCSIENT